MAERCSHRVRSRGEATHRTWLGCGSGGAVLGFAGGCETRGEDDAFRNKSISVVSTCRGYASRSTAAACTIRRVSGHRAEAPIKPTPPARQSIQLWCGSTTARVRTLATSRSTVTRRTRRRAPIRRPVCPTTRRKRCALERTVKVSKVPPGTPVRSPIVARGLWTETAVRVRGALRVREALADVRHRCNEDSIEDPDHAGC